jgi:hypothetical protein
VKVLDVLLRRSRPDDERTQKGQAIADLEERSDAELARIDSLISERLASYQAIRLRR